MPTPNKGESKKDFLSRCMGDSEANHTFPDEKQRYAFCQSQWKNKKEAFEMEEERRFIPVDGLEVRKDENGNPTGIHGTAAVYDKGTVIAGMFEERIAPGAFDDVLKEGQDVRGLFNHDPNYPLGRTSAGTMELSDTAKGLRYEIPELPKTRADVLEAIQRGDVTGNSFSFVINSDDDEEWTNREDQKKLPLRIIKRVGKLMDVGPVTFPAYKQTKVSARVEQRCKDMAPEPESNGFKRLQENRRRRLRLDGKSE